MSAENKRNESYFTICIKNLQNLSCIPQWKEKYYDPIIQAFPEDLPTEIFTKIVQQGSTLCILANLVQKHVIDPDEIYPLNMKEESPFSNSKSKLMVNKFLDVCKTHLMISSDEAFLSYALYQNDLEALSKAASMVDLLLKRIKSRRLAHLTKPVLSFDSGDDKEAEEKIAPNLRSSLYSGKSSEQPVSSRDKAIEELLTTERNYVNDLEKLYEYVQTVQMDSSHEKLISNEILFQIFGTDLSNIVNFQRRFLYEMEIILFKPEGSQKLGSLFVNSVDVDKSFSVYDTFCNNYQNAIELIEQYKEPLQRYNWIIPSTQLPSYLIRPIQRICKYHLLLREIIKRTSESHSDINDLKMGLEVMKRVAGEVNENQRKIENLYLAHDMKNRIEDWKGLKFEDLGSLIHKGSLKIINIKDFEKENPIVYLFEKFILFCKESVFIPKIREKALKIKFFIEIASVLVVKPIGDISFEILWGDASYSNKASLIFHNEEVSSKWFISIDRLTTVNNPALAIASPEASKRRPPVASKKNLQSICTTYDSLSSKNRPFPPEEPTNLEESPEGAVSSVPFKGFEDTVHKFSLELWQKLKAHGEGLTLSSKYPFKIPKLIKCHYEDWNFLLRFSFKEGESDGFSPCLMMAIKQLFSRRIFLICNLDYENSNSEFKEFTSSLFIYYRDRKGELIFLFDSDDLEMACMDWDSTDPLVLVIKADIKDKLSTH